MRLALTAAPPLMASPTSLYPSSKGGPDPRQRPADHYANVMGASARPEHDHSRQRSPPPFAHGGTTMSPLDIIALVSPIALNTLVTLVLRGHWWRGLIAPAQFSVLWWRLVRTALRTHGRFTSRPPGQRSPSRGRSSSDPRIPSRGRPRPLLSGHHAARGGKDGGRTDRQIGPKLARVDLGE